MRPLGFLNPHYTFWISGKTTKGRRAGVHEQASNSLFDFSRRWRTVARCNCERTRGTNEDRYITLDHCQARSFETSAPSFALEFVTTANRQAHGLGGWTFPPWIIYPSRKPSYPEGRFAMDPTPMNFLRYSFEISRCTYVLSHLSSFDATRSMRITVGCLLSVSQINFHNYS